MIYRPLILISALGVAILPLSACSLNDQAATVAPLAQAVQVNDSPNSAPQPSTPQTVAQGQGQLTNQLQGLQLDRVSFSAFDLEGNTFCEVDLDFPNMRVRIMAKPHHDWQGIFYFDASGEPWAEYGINQRTGQLNKEDAYLHEGLLGSFIFKMAQMNYEQCAL
ncbi:hypothetical protein H6F75_26845 [Nodosilinea sp. FACHB-131]|uniref:hypothetical protein n=1 Tax=Cyanophyceae TaxID=3028117 RepID=UPI001689BEB8|nr:hypothetical protein [Nodosilinea sp. FACHB-131]MBD1877107.1 hypothetical protein [Nodosilinea sp. FACHB-131]